MSDVIKSVDKPLALSSDKVGSERDRTAYNRRVGGYGAYAPWPNLLRRLHTPRTLSPCLAQDCLDLSVLGFPEFESFSL